MFPKRQSAPRAQPTNNSSSTQLDKRGTGPDRNLAPARETIEYSPSNKSNVTYNNNHSPLPNKNNKNYSYSDCSVVNLSNKHLSTAQMSLLSKGLNFCPTPHESNLGTIRQDFEKFHKVYNVTVYSDSTADNPLRILVAQTRIQVTMVTTKLHPLNIPVSKKMSQWNPTGPLSLEAFIISNEADLSRLVPAKPNISISNLRKERQ